MTPEELETCKKLIDNSQYLEQADVDYLVSKAPKGAITSRYYNGKRTVYVSLLFKIQLGMI